MAKLVGTTGNNGYFTILDRSFEEEPPTPSGFCQFRKSISHKFFKDLFYAEIQEWQEKKQPKYEGLRVNAIDGDKLILPYSEDIIAMGYRGIPCKEGKETHYPAMYYCCATDVITGAPVGFSQSHENDEISRAIEILKSYRLPEKTLTIFDRFYFSKRLLSEYQQENRGYFLARCKMGSTFKEIVEFTSSDLQEKNVTIEGVKCRLIRFTVPSSGEETILITNLPKRFKNRKIQRLYGYRWESETGNRDRTTTIKLEQMRAKNINGIQQEIWMTLLLQAVSQIACAEEVKPERYFMEPIYFRANFKAIFNRIVDKINWIIRGVKSTFEITKNLVLRSMQKRKHYSRHYERQTKQILGKTFKRKSLVARRD